MTVASTTGTQTPRGVINVLRTGEPIDPANALSPALSRIESYRGAIFASGYEFPGRYSRWDIAFTDPPLEFIGYGRSFRLAALNERGRRLLQIFEPALRNCPGMSSLEIHPDRIEGSVLRGPEFFDEEERSRRPTVFTPLRCLCSALRTDNDNHLGFYGAVGHDAVFQFEALQLRHDRNPLQADLHLFLPDELVVVDHQRNQATTIHYDFEREGISTRGLSRETAPVHQPSASETRALVSDHDPGEYASKVQKVREGCFRGDYFEVTLSQTFSRSFSGSATRLFERIRRSNPSPYEFLINLGPEQLVGASPEMYVRVEGSRVETCPIAGTARRPASLMDEARVIGDLLQSEKDTAELTMCSDVDRNDKARVCKPGTVRVIGRRQIETYSRLFHTVDHIVGELRPDCDGFDALLSHMWACTLTGAPKPAALQAIEDLEKSPRGWYGGCVGMFLANGNINTGIAIRTLQLRDRIATLRVGATLLADSDPEAEERETRVKASAFLDALTHAESEAKTGKATPSESHHPGEGKRVLFVDHRDSFVHTLADYVRRTGAKVRTVRAGFPTELLIEEQPDLVFLSPGPGSPHDFGVENLVRMCVEHEIPVFGVCLGLQGMVEAFGGQLAELPYPMHGKPSMIEVSGGEILRDLPSRFEVGRYHSLHALENEFPDCLEISSRSEDGVVMAVEHRQLPLAAVQFHPESILSMKDDLGMRIIRNVMDRLAGRPYPDLLVEPIREGEVVSTDDKLG